MKIGDIVRLKSGGPSMTVHAIRPVEVRKEELGRSINVWWFADNGQLQRDLIPEALLDYDDPQGYPPRATKAGDP